MINLNDWDSLKHPIPGMRYGTHNGEKAIMVPLRQVEELFKDTPFRQSWPYRAIDVDHGTGMVSFYLADWLNLNATPLTPGFQPTIFPVLSSSDLGDKKPWGWQGLPDSPVDDDKTQVIPNVTKCSYAQYKDYMGLNESFRYCTKCGKKESEHE